MELKILIACVVAFLIGVIVYSADDDNWPDWPDNFGY